MTHPRRRQIVAVVSVAAFLAAGFLAWRLHTPPALYHMTILPWRGDWRTAARGLNDSDQVIGVASVPGNDEHLFLWDRENGMRDLGPTSANPLLISNAGQISGTISTGPDSQEVYLWQSEEGRALLGTLGGQISIPKAMNNRGQIVGLSDNAAGAVRPFLWDKEMGMKELSSPDGSQCNPVSINDAGQIVLESTKQSPTSNRWFLLDANGWKPLDRVPPDMWLRSINANLCMVGIQNRGSPKSRLLFRDQQGTWRRLSSMVDHLSSTRLNDKNQIAYTKRDRNLLEGMWHRFFARRSLSFETVSYLWDPIRGQIPLNRYVHGMKRFYVEDLNNRGCIVGTAENEYGGRRSVLLEPIPERWGK
ncbi:MAG: hypothetical protein ABFD90_20160 [Phycisphaerales bacterium]